MKNKFLSLSLVVFMNSCAPALVGKLQNATALDTGSLRKNPVFTHARVNITSIDAKIPISYIIKVGEDGTFVFDEDVPVGRYHIEALVPGYRVSSQEIRLESSQKIMLTLEPLVEVTPGIFGLNLEIDASRGSGGAMLTPPQL